MNELPWNVLGRPLHSPNTRFVEGLPSCSSEADKTMILEMPQMTEWRQPASWHDVQKKRARCHAQALGHCGVYLYQGRSVQNSFVRLTEETSHPVELTKATFHIRTGQEALVCTREIIWLRVIMHHASAISSAAVYPR
jgi:hypothetical protein